MVFFSYINTVLGPFDEIYLLSPFQDEKMLLQLAQRLRPSAKLFIQTNKIQNGSQMEKQLIVALTKAGYVDIKTTTEDQVGIYFKLLLTEDFCHQT